MQLVVKTLHFSGEMSGAHLAQTMGLSIRSSSRCLIHLKQTTWRRSRRRPIGRPAFVYRLTEAGRQRALLFLEQSHYVGRGSGAVRAIRHLYAGVRRRDAEGGDARTCARRLSQLVLSQRVLDQLGPAINGAHSLFVYGPPGNGKTVVSQAVRNLLDGEIAIPHALIVGRSHHQGVRPGGHESLRRLTWTAERSTPALTARCTLGALPASVGHGRRRTGADTTWTCPTALRPSSTRPRSRSSPTAACSSSTTSAARSCRRSTC